MKEERWRKAPPKAEGFKWGLMAEIRSSGVLLGRFRQTTLGFLLGKIPRLVEWILLAKVYRSSSLTRLDSTISNPADDPRPWTKSHDSSSKSYEIF